MTLCAMCRLFRVMVILSYVSYTATPQEHRFPDSPVPPTLYEDKGACPFEGCVYREWTANRAVVLFDRPNGKQVGQLKKDDNVKGITGMVYTVPNKVQVVFPHGNYGLGDVFYTLTYFGEGFSKVWFQGAVHDEDISDLPFDGVGHNRPHPLKCITPSRDCWWNIDSPIRKSIWWVQIKTSSGLVAWAISDGNFDNQDALGGG